MIRKYGRLNLFLGLLLGALGCAQPARGVEPNVLIYCDKSPGAVPHAIVLQERIEGQNGTWTYATDATQFQTRLAQGGWSEVHVLAKHSATEPAYASALRNYAGANALQPIMMVIWKEHTAPPTANHAVLATTALVVWLNGQTTTNYALRGDGQQEPATTASGLSFPDFRGIQTGAYAEIAEFSEETDGGETQSFMWPFPLPACYVECLQAYLNSMNTCTHDYETHRTGAQALYGPTEGNPGDPPRFAQEMKKAGEDYANCIQGAVNRWNIYIAQCNSSMGGG